MKKTVVWSDGDLIKEKIYIYLAFYFVSTFFLFPIGSIEGVQCHKVNKCFFFFPTENGTVCNCIVS